MLYKNVNIYCRRDCGEIVTIWKQNFFFVWFIFFFKYTFRISCLGWLKLLIQYTVHFIMIFVGESICFTNNFQSMVANPAWLGKSNSPVFFLIVFPVFFLSVGNYYLPCKLLSPAPSPSLPSSSSSPSSSSPLLSPSLQKVPTQATAVE